MTRIRFSTIAILLVSLFWSVAANADLVPDADRLLSRVRVLTAPALAGRGSGSVELMSAADTLADWLSQAGLVPAFDGAWFQDFDLTGQGWTGNELSGLQDRNVAGIMLGEGELAGRYVVIGAHFDHLGRLVPAAGSAPPPGAQDYYPGANDNASGVTVVCELMALMRDRSL